MANVHSTADTQRASGIANGAFAGTRKQPITREQIKQRIVRTEYVRSDSGGSICFITLDNGFAVAGESICIEDAGVNCEQSDKLAYEDAVDELFPYFSFTAREEIYREELARQCMAEAA